MPTVSGWYTFCPQEDTGANPNMLDLLHDVKRNAGKIAFFDVQVDVSCVMGVHNKSKSKVSRTTESNSVTYDYETSAGKGAKTYPLGIKSTDLVSDNGTLISVLGDRDGRNAFTSLGINIEGADDVLYGPYLIKASSDDAITLYTLSAPVLDSTMQESASKIAAQRRAARESAPPTKGLPQPIQLSADEIRELQQSVKARAVTEEPSEDQPRASLPPIPPESLRGLPPIPTLPPPPPIKQPTAKSANDVR
ncbi:hypothetical protein A9975_29105 [Cupriavidus sp. UME77]|nr:hypothetical protein [Cupriavidus sp. UME77]